MSDLREKVLEIFEASRDETYECRRQAAQAAISICMEEAAKVAKGYHSFPAPTSRAARYHEMHCVKPNIAAAILSLKGGGDG